MIQLSSRLAALSLLTTIVTMTINADGQISGQVSVRTRKQYSTTQGINYAEQEIDTNDVKMLHELLPRQVNELGLKLGVKHRFNIKDEKPVNTVLFHGPPGLGKTQAAKLLAKLGKTNFIELRSTRMQTKWQASAVEAFNDATSKADAHYEKTKETSTIFMDEFDALGRDLDDANASTVVSNSTKKDALMEIWQFIENNANNPRYIFVFGTNHMKVLHKTFISRFREENIIEFKLPDAKQRKIAFEYYLQKYEFSLEKELNVSPVQAEKTLAMLVKYSDKMNLRSIKDSVRSFKGQKSLSALSDEDIANVLRYIDEESHHQLELEELKKTLSTTFVSEKKDKIDATIIAIHEKITGKPVSIKASTNKELYEILQRTRAKDGYNWYEAFKKQAEDLNKEVRPFSDLLYNSRVIIGLSATAVATAIAGYQYLVKPQINPNNDPQVDRLIEQQVNLHIMRLVRAGMIGGAGAAGVAGTAIAANNGAIASNFNPATGTFTNLNSSTGNFCGPYG